MNTGDRALDLRKLPTKGAWQAAYDREDALAGHQALTMLSQAA
jgi:hypothetical protein